MLVLVIRHVRGHAWYGVMSGERGEGDVSVMREIRGLNLEIVVDNDSSLQSVVNAALLKLNCRSLRARRVSVARPQAKRLEQAVGICKEGLPCRTMSKWA